MNGWWKHPSAGEKVTLGKMDNYRMLDIVKYAAAIMVICIHCNQIFPQEFTNFMIQNVICRIAVPFFFIVSAYFIRKSVNKNPQYINGYLKKTVIAYCLWSLAFVPIGVNWINQDVAISENLLPMAALYGLIHVGTYYHLWYVPALIFSLFVINKLLKYTSYKILFAVCSLLFLFGSIETYYGLLPAGWFKDLFDALMSVIFTTRSGLLYGALFVLMGFFVYDYQEKLRVILKSAQWLVVLFGVLLIIEGSLLFRVSRLDTSFLIMLIPFSFFFFLWVISFPYRPKIETKKIRELSKYYYFVHPICIIMLEQIGAAFGLTFFSAGLIGFLSIVALTHLLSVLVLKMKTSLTSVHLVFSALCGLVITFMLAGLFFLLKAVDSIIQFEFVACLWFASSFVYAYLLYKNRQKAGAPLQ